MRNEFKPKLSIFYSLRHKWNCRASKTDPFHRQMLVRIQNFNATSSVFIFWCFFPSHPLEPLPIGSETEDNWMEWVQRPPIFFSWLLFQLRSKLRLKSFFGVRYCCQFLVKRRSSSSFYAHRKRFLNVTVKKTPNTTNYWFREMEKSIQR